MITRKTSLNIRYLLMSEEIISNETERQYPILLKPKRAKFHDTIFHPLHYDHHSDREDPPNATWYSETTRTRVNQHSTGGTFQSM